MFVCWRLDSPLFEPKPVVAPSDTPSVDNTSETRSSNPSVSDVIDKGRLSPDSVPPGKAYIQIKMLYKSITQCQNTMEIGQGADLLQVFNYDIIRGINCLLMVSLGTGHVRESPKVVRRRVKSLSPPGIWTVNLYRLVIYKNI